MKYRFEAGQSVILVSGKIRALWVSDKRGVFYRNRGIVTDIPKELNAKDGSFQNYVNIHVAKYNLKAEQDPNMKEMVNLVSTEESKKKGVSKDHR